MTILGDVSTIAKGRKAPEVFSFPMAGALPYLQIEDLRPGAKPKYARDSKGVVAYENDVIIAWDGANSGTVGFGLSGYIGSTLAALRFKDSEVFGPYVGYFLHSKFDEIQTNTTGATIPHVDRRYLEAIEIEVPPLAEQRRVAAVLSTADRLRRLRRYALELSEGFLQSVFLEIFGDPATNPMGWDVHRLGKHIRFITSGSRGWAKYYSATGARFIRSLDVQMNHIADTDAVYVNPPEGAEANRTVVKEGDVLLTITGSRIGRVAPVAQLDDSEAYISQHVAIVRLDDEIDPTFVSRFLSLDAGGQRQIRRMQYGQTKPGLSLGQIQDFTIPVPPQPLRRKYLDVTKKFEHLQFQQREAIHQADHLFDTLLHRAFRGEL